VSHCYKLNEFKVPNEYIEIVLRIPKED